MRDPTSTAVLKCKADLVSRQCGGQNCHLDVEFADGVTWLARVRLDDPLLPPPDTQAHIFLSEVATLQFVGKEGVPAPRVYAYGLESPDNAVGTSYIHMEKLQGKPLDWGRATTEQRTRVMEQLADLYLELEKHPIPLTGSLVPVSGHAGVKTTTLEVLRKFPASNRWITPLGRSKPLRRHTQPSSASNRIYFSTRGQQPAVGQLPRLPLASRGSAPAIRQLRLPSGTLLPQALRRQGRPHPRRRRLQHHRDHRLGVFLRRGQGAGLQLAVHDVAHGRFLRRQKRARRERGAVCRHFRAARAGGTWLLSSAVADAGSATCSSSAVGYPRVWPSSSRCSKVYGRASRATGSRARLILSGVEARRLGPIRQGG